MDVSILISFLSVVGVIIGIVVNLNAIAKDKEQRGREMGQIHAAIEHHKESIKRSFEEIEKVKCQIHPMSEAIISIKVGIDHIMETLREMKNEHNQR